jgi:hypothetical protein
MVPEVDFKLSDLDALREEVSSGASRVFALVSKVPDAVGAEAAPSP